MPRSSRVVGDRECWLEKQLSTDRKIFACKNCYATFVPQLTYRVCTSVGVSSITGSEYTEESVIEGRTGLTFDQVPMHVHSDDDDNDRKRRVVHDLDDDL